ncbi:MAG: 3-isopropylmalate dehydrogenase [Candidatus Dormibacteria bacterium]
MTGQRIVVLAGDGVGPEVTAAGVRVLTAACAAAGIAIDLQHHLIGGVALETEGMPLPDATIAACQASDAVLLGAVGGPKWDHLRGPQRCEAGLLRLRSELGVFANLRPVRVHPAMADRSAVRREVVEGTDLIVVRELTGGAYFGMPKGREGSGPGESAVDTTRYSRVEIERVARVAFELAQGRRRKLTSVDKANVLATSGLWRDVVSELGAEYPDVTLEHQLADSCAMRLIQAPTSFDVIVTENLFGDILSDEAGVLVGSLGVLPSASVGAAGPGLYEPIHGSAPDIAGTGRANPVGAILSVAMALRLSLGAPAVAAQVERAVDAVLASGVVTPDLGGTATTAAMEAAVLARLEAAVAADLTHAG